MDNHYRRRTRYSTSFCFNFIVAFRGYSDFLAFRVNVFKTAYVAKSFIKRLNLTNNFRSKLTVKYPARASEFLFRLLWSLLHELKEIAIVLWVKTIFDNGPALAYNILYVIWSKNNINNQYEQADSIVYKLEKYLKFNTELFPHFCIYVMPVYTDCIIGSSAW